MRRWLCGLAMFAGLGALTLDTAIAQDAKKDEKKTEKKAEKKARPPKVAYTEAKEAGPDFAIQGEYEGEDPSNKEKVGVQVVAKGDGKFEGKLLRGGLPGAGYNGKDEVNLKGSIKDGKLVLDGVVGKEVREDLVNIQDGTATLKRKDAVVTAKRIERKSPTLGAEPPKGAVVLFGKPEDAEKWTGGKIRKLSDGEFLQEGCKSKDAFGDCKLHVEFRLAFMPKEGGQLRSNSGVYLQDRYEVQVLDSFGLKGLNNECGGIYTISAPKMNMCFPPLQWQTYDIDFTAAKFDADGKKTANGRITVVHNGVTVQDNVELPKETGGGQKESAMPGPIQLQNHGDPLVFRNIWILPK